MPRSNDKLRNGPQSKRRTRAQDGKFTNRRGAKGAPRNQKGKFK